MIEPRATTCRLGRHGNIPSQPTDKHDIEDGTIYVCDCGMTRWVYRVTETSWGWSDMDYLFTTSPDALSVLGLTERSIR